MICRNAWRVRPSCVFFLVILGLSVPNGGFAQPQPTSLSISPSSIVQGQCYTMYVGNGAYMTLDMQYTLNGAAQPPIIGWPTLDGAGTASPCTSSSTPTGNYVFTAIRNTLNTEWVSVYAPITVNPPPPPPDFSLSVSPSSATIDQGQTTSYSVDVSPMNGFSSSVSLSVAGLPSGVSASFSPNPVSAGGSSTLTISSSTTAGTGSFGLTVTGSGGGLTRYTYPSLTVNPRQ